MYSDISNVEFLQKNIAKATEYSELSINTDPTNELGYIAYVKSTLVSDKKNVETNIGKMEMYLLKAEFLAPKKVEVHYWK